MVHTVILRHKHAPSCLPGANHIRAPSMALAKLKPSSFDRRNRRELQHRPADDMRHEHPTKVPDHIMTFCSMKKYNNLHPSRARQQARSAAPFHPKTHHITARDSLPADSTPAAQPARAAPPTDLS